MKRESISMHTGSVARLLQLALVLVLPGCPSPVQIEAEPCEPVAVGVAAKTEILNLARELPFSTLYREAGRIDFGTELARSHLGEGWTRESGDAARSWIWATGMHSVVEFFLDEARDLEMAARCWPFNFPDAPRQAIRVEVNGIEVTSFEMEAHPREYAWRVEERLLRSGTNQLTFEYARSDAPIDVLADTPDPRPLSVAWDWLQIGRHPAAGLPTVESSKDIPTLILPVRTRMESYFSLPAGAEFRVDRVVPVQVGQTDDAILKVRLDAEYGAFAFEWRIATSREPQSIEVPGPVQTVATPKAQGDPIVRLSMQVESQMQRGSSDDAERSDAGLILGNPRILAPRGSMPASRGSAASPRRTAMLPRPNVLIFLIDALRAINLGTFGHEPGHTPRIDAFAKTATNFVNARANAPWTRPGVASVLTGLTPWQHHANQVEDGLPEGVATLAELLSAEGYATGAIITNGNLNTQFGFGQGFESFEALPEDLNRRGVHVDSARLREAGIDWLKSRPKGRPFFLYLHATDPHAPYAPPIADLEKMTPRIANPELTTLDFVGKLTTNQIPVEDGIAEALESLYDAEISHLDAELGRLLDNLESDLGILEDTLIVVTSDHGEEFYEHGWWQHGKTLYDEQLHIPLIIRFPGGRNSGEIRRDPAQQIDIVPTVLAAAGIAIPGNLTGRDLLEPPANADEIGALALLDKDHRHAESIVYRGFKLIDYITYEGPNKERLPTQLFDLSRDPGELHNLAEQRPILTGYLRELLRRSQAEMAPIEEEGAVEISPETEATLRALGYVE